MYVYAKYCPVAAATSVIGDFWTPMIVRELLYGTGGFNQLARNVPGISRTVLAGRLHALETANVVQRDSPELGKSAAYRLTAAGEALRPIIEALNQWGSDWGAPHSDDDDIDPVVSVCMLKSRIQPASAPTSRVVIEVAVTPDRTATAWIVCERNQVSMCFEKPGYEIDLYVSASVTTLYQIWLERLTVREALQTARLSVAGPGSLVAQLPTWFEDPV